MIDVTDVFHLCLFCFLYLYFIKQPLTEDADPVLIEEINEKRSFDFPIKGHVELGEDLDIIRLK